MKRYNAKAKQLLCSFSISLNYMLYTFQQNDFDMLLVNLRMDAVNVKENMRISWASEAGLVENVSAVIKEYKDTGNLHVCSVIMISDS